MRQYSRRKPQYTHVSNTIGWLRDQNPEVKDQPDKTYPGEMGFTKLKTLLVKTNRVMEGIKADRYTAMVLSIAKGGTTDEDVNWHWL